MRGRMIGTVCQIKGDGGEILRELHGSGIGIMSREEGALTTQFAMRYEVGWRFQRHAPQLFPKLYLVQKTDLSCHIAVH